MNLGLKDKTILVTAASRGLGFGAAEALVQEEANVVICGRTEESLKAAVSKLGKRAEYVVADVSRHDDIKTLTSFVENKAPRLLFLEARSIPITLFPLIQKVPKII